MGAITVNGGHWPSHHGNTYFIASYVHNRPTVADPNYII